MRASLLPLLLFTGVASAAAAPPAGNPLAPPPPERLERARELVAKMQAADRGPYKHLRWFCNDGSVHPPKPYPCEARGGGHQHAEYSEDRQRLTELGWSVGTIYTGMGFAELWDEAGHHDRMRQLPLERYLIDVDRDWVLRKARGYRGRIQAEDEEEFGGRLLQELLARPGFAEREYLLLRELVRTVPHAGGGEDRSRTARRQSKELAELDPGFEPLRIRIHTDPRAAELADTREWLSAARARGAGESVLRLAAELVRTLERMQDERSLERVAARSLERLASRSFGPALRSELEELGRLPAAERAKRLGRLLVLTRRQVEAGASPADALALLDLSIPAEAGLLSSALEALDGGPPSRREALELALALVDGAHGAGWLSLGEHADLQARLSAALASDPASVDDLSAAARQVERAAAWAQGAVHHAFSGALVRYAALEPKATAFVDDLLRGSSMLALARVGRLLAADAQALSGVRTTAFGRPAAGLAGLNPGLAIGRLRVLTDEDLAAGRSAAGDEIVVLPRTVSELEPVAGILTVDEGNVLSHVQLLARNLGIPNVAVSAALAPELARRAGREVVLAVAPDGSVALHELEAVREGLPAEARPAAAHDADSMEKVSAPRPRLEASDPLPLARLEASLSGQVVGPKAANLGELARLFPGRVSPAIGLPFGLFAAHAADGEASPKARLERAFRAHRAGEIDDTLLAAEVDAVRAAVAAIELHPETRGALTSLMAELFGPAGTYGVFVRSDTNVEDLPGFTGAGLNLTLPHVVGLEAQLAAIPKVWASPFRARAMAWRERALANPEEVYPSVLLQKSVPVDKSGVLVTTDLVNRRPGLTVASAWGVGGAVDGESAETIVLRPDGTVERVAEAKAPWRRSLPASGGVAWVPAPAGPVLTPDEQAQLRELAADVARVMEPATDPSGRPLPWDVEFGFEQGRLRLFQIRPLVERSAAKAARVVLALNGAPPPAVESVPLDAPASLTGAGGAS